MPKNAESIRLLLISPSQARAELLSRMLQQQQLKTVLDVIRPSRSAVASVRRTVACGANCPFDVLLMDLAAAGKEMLGVLSELTFGIDRVSTPTVLLTDETAEAMLESGQLKTGDSIMFAPTSLPSFLGKMRQVPQHKFLHALSKLSGIGPVLVRLPTQFTRTLDELPPQQASLIAA